MKGKDWCVWVYSTRNEQWELVAIFYNTFYKYDGESAYGNARIYIRMILGECEIYWRHEIRLLPAGRKPKEVK